MMRCFGTKNNRHHLVGLFTSSATFSMPIHAKPYKNFRIFNFVSFEQGFPKCLANKTIE